MIIKFIKKNQLFILSIMLHAMVLLLIGLRLNLFYSEVNLGEIQSAVPSYVLQERMLNTRTENKMENNIAEKMKSNPPKEHIAYHKKINKSRTQSSHSSKNKTKTQHAQQPTKSGNGKAIAELIALLHAAIQEHQQYPSSALEMEREGNATLVFTLLPNGAVKRLRLLQSSGVTALDEAAIAAINDALPFKGIDKFLKNPTEFQITVGFQLT